MNKSCILLLQVLACALFLYATDCSAYSNVNQGCLTCHSASSLMAVPGPMTSSCTNCHVTPGDSYVLSAKCIVCHPIGNPGQCNLVNLASHPTQTCLLCHKSCSTSSTTTTSVMPTTTTTSIINTTTTSIPNGAACGGCGQPPCDLDTDGDGIPDYLDNCPTVYNPNQLDANGNGTGDCCDPNPGCGGCGLPACDTLCAKP